MILRDDYVIYAHLYTKFHDHKRYSKREIGGGKLPRRPKIENQTFTQKCVTNTKSLTLPKRAIVASVLTTIIDYTEMCNQHKIPKVNVYT